MKNLIILGAGTAGTTVANRMRTRLPRDWARIRQRCGTATSSAASPRRAGAQSSIKSRTRASAVPAAASHAELDAAEADRGPGERRRVVLLRKVRGDQVAQARALQARHQRSDRLDVAGRGATGARLAWVPRRAGERGALEAGALPGLLFLSFTALYGVYLLTKGLPVVMKSPAVPLYG